MIKAAFCSSQESYKKIWDAVIPERRNPRFDPHGWISFELICADGNLIAFFVVTDIEKLTDQMKDIGLTIAQWHEISDAIKGNTADFLPDFNSFVNVRPGDDREMVFVFWPSNKDRSLGVGGRLASGMGIHVVTLNNLEEARKIIECDLRYERDIMVIEGSQTKRWIDKEFPWEDKG
jgi:hypothetical protein